MCSMARTAVKRWPWILFLWLLMPAVLFLSVSLTVSQLSPPVQKPQTEDIVGTYLPSPDTAQFLKERYGSATTSVGLMSDAVVEFIRMPKEVSPAGKLGELVAGQGSWDLEDSEER